MTIIAAIIALATILGIGWFAVQAQRSEGGRMSLRGSLRKMKRAIRRDEVDETFAHQIVPADQDARDKGAI